MNMWTASEGRTRESQPIHLWALGLRRERSSHSVLVLALGGGGLADVAVANLEVQVAVVLLVGLCGGRNKQEIVSVMLQPTLGTPSHPSQHHDHFGTPPREQISSCGTSTKQGCADQGRKAVFLNE